MSPPKTCRPCGSGRRASPRARHRHGAPEAAEHLLGGPAPPIAAEGPKRREGCRGEFGRRVKENGDHGVDHGYGNAMLLLGSGVNGGGVRGLWPHLSTLEDGDLAIKQDFRSVLWEVLASRFPEISGQRDTVFPGFVPESVGAMS